MNLFINHYASMEVISIRRTSTFYIKKNYENIINTYQLYGYIKNVLKTTTAKPLDRVVTVLRAKLLHVFSSKPYNTLYFYWVTIVIRKTYWWSKNFLQTKKVLIYTKIPIVHYQIVVNDHSRYPRRFMKLRKNIVFI